MRKWLCLGLMTLLLCINGCGDGSLSTEHSEIMIPVLTIEPTESQSTLTAADHTEIPDLSPETAPTESTDLLPETAPTEIEIIFPAPLTTAEPEQTEHSEYYITDLETDTLIQYFNEVVLDAEYINYGNASLVQKWDSKVLYFIHGEPTQTDLKYLDSTVDWLNSIFGFPGMEETKNEQEANLQIYFTDHQSMMALMGKQYEFSDGAVNFSYNNNRIYKGIICYRTDIDQYVRNSVVQEEIYNAMGPIQDTDLRPDSMIYSGYSVPQQMTDVDKLIMNLLYHPDIDFGMNADECESVIRQLYY